MSWEELPFLVQIGVFYDLAGKNKNPVLQLILSNLEVSECDTEAVTAVTGSLTTLYVLMNHTTKQGSECRLQ